MNAAHYRYLNEPTYTDEQIMQLRNALNDKYKLAFDLTLKCGLRIFEISSLDMEVESDHYYYIRNNEHVLLTIPNQIRIELEKVKRETLIITKDHNCRFESHYDLHGGRAFANALSHVSKELFGYSLGTKALRVTYCQRQFLNLSRVSSPQQVISRLKKQFGNLKK
ncbi:hypothetical protein [Photobacterium damselae]|uniref:hypothetical protein n=1 Tax=Photobacterium damselae TaxID=38293 RepID=UPI004067984C